MPSSPQPPDRVMTPDEYPPYEGLVALRCRPCGKTGKYSVGRICVDPDLFKNADNKELSYEEMIGFTGYFHCRHCGAGGPWEFPVRTKLQLQVLMIQATQSPADSPVIFGRPRMFDGTFSHTATEGEAHLRKLIEANPTDFYLWSRLGNLYEHAEQHELAIAAFERAVELNAQDVESHYSLGYYCMERKQPARAAEHFIQLLRYARTATRVRPGLLKQLVRETLGQLFNLRVQSGGAIEFPSLDDLPAHPGGAAAPKQLILKGLDVAREETWEALTTMYLTGHFPGVAPARTAPARTAPAFLPRSPNPPAPGRPVRVGRNQPCPCGSGRKFKHCCGRPR